MRWIMIVITVAFLLSSFLAYDSGSRGGGGQADYAVAEINGKKLMLSALNRRVGAYLEEMGNRELTSLDWPQIYQSTLRQYAMEQQMAQEVRDSGISVTDEEVKQEVNDYADRAFPTREAFYETLERSGMKLADYQRDVAQQMAGQRLIQATIGAVTVSEDEAVQFYDSTKELFFRQPAGFKVSMANFSGKEPAEKLRKLLEDGKSWEAVTSEDRPASSDMLAATTEPRFIPESAFQERFAPMKDLKIGEVSAVFELVSDDWVVAIKNEAVEAKTTPYAEVSADIRMLLQQQKERESMERFSQALLERAQIKILDASLFPSQRPEVLPVTENVSGDAPTEQSALKPEGVVSGEKQ